MELETERLLLRRWREEDRVPYALLNADPRVMEHFPSTLTHAESDGLIERFERHFEANGFGISAVERRDTGELIGSVGLQRTGFEAVFTPCVELAWRIAAEHQGQGFATEAAERALRFGFEDLDLDEQVCFTFTGNHASERVMQKLGLRARPERNFDHPSLPEGDRLRPHIFYSLTQSEWRAAKR